MHQSSSSIPNKSHKPWLSFALKKSIMAGLLQLILSNFFLNKYKLYRNKKDSINRYITNSFIIKFKAFFCEIKKIWDNIMPSLLINKKQPSSYIEKMHVNDKGYQHPQSYSFNACINIAKIGSLCCVAFFCYTDNLKFWFS